ncbi:MAG: recombinase family protein [Eubacteriaceae bacterium]|jgi:DNA invertase Pin-like site-specific DNA recombinase|nr:recombinase family protein [Eubacteriaceae bacterium]
MESNITVIPARRHIGNTVKEQDEHTKLRVTAYCRVSTDTDEQETSYDTQVKHYTEYIQQHPDWKFAGIFADDGISGTNVKKRDEFNRMIGECMSGNIDMVITKSISRFARNTLDCLKFIRQLRDKNIPVYFEKENINSMDSKGEVLLTIMASLAQQESQSLSQNVKLGIQFRYQSGKVQVNHNRFLGYTKDEDGNLIVDKTESEAIKRIFREYLEGESLMQIGRGLEADGILTGAGKQKWRPETIKKMLKNEKYMGDALLQKTYTTDFIEKTRVKNNGIVPQYYVENSHEAIIPKDIFMQVQEEMVRRSNLYSGGNRKKRVYSSKYALSGMVCCSKCGEIYRRLAWNNRGKRSVVWRCCTRVEHGPSACDAETIQEVDLQMATVRAINKAIQCSDSMLKILKENLTSVIDNSTKKEMAEIDDKMAARQQDLFKATQEMKPYDDIADAIEDLRDQKKKVFAEKAEQEGNKLRIKEMTEFLSGMNHMLIDYDEQMVRRYIERITVYDSYYEVEFKSGIKVEIEK